MPDPIRLIISAQPDENIGPKMLGMATALNQAFTDGAARAGQAYSAVESRFAEMIGRLIVLAGGIGPALAAGLGIGVSAVEAHLNRIRTQMNSMSVPTHFGGAG